MRQSVFRCLIVGAYLASHAYGSLSFDQIFEIQDKPEELGYCDSTKGDTMVLHTENMQSAASEAHLSLPKLQWNRKVRALPVMNLFLDVFKTSSAYDRTAMITETTSNFISPSALPVDRRHFVLCDSTPIKLMRHDEELPSAFIGRRTVGQLYGSGDDYWYFWVSSVEGMSRVSKKVLPPIADGKDGAGFPFPGANYCTDPQNPAWSLVIDKWSGFIQYPDEEHPPNRVVFVLCPDYFTATNPNTQSLLPSAIDLEPQVKDTPLDDMRPAWLAWYIEVIRVAISSRHNNKLAFSGVDAKEVKAGGNRAQKDDWKDLTGQQALTAEECILLTEWQRAQPPNRPFPLPKYWWPGIFNPPSFAWLTVAIWLQEKGVRPQSWATGFAGDFFDGGVAPSGGGGSGGGDDGGDGGEGSSRGGAGQEPELEPPEQDAPGVLLSAMDDCNEGTDDGSGGDMEL